MLLAPTAAHANEPLRRIGVVVSVAVNVTADEARELASTLGTALEERLPVDVIAGQEAERLMPPKGLPKQCLANQQCRQELGQRLDASELLFLVLVRVGDETQIDSTWANAATGAVASRPAIRLTTSSAMAETFARSATELLPHITPRSPRDATAQPGSGTGASSGRQPGSQSDNQSDIPRSPAAAPAAAVDGGRNITTGAWFAAGVAVAGLAGGTLWGLSAQSKHGELSDHCDPMGICAPEYEDTISGLRRAALLSDISFAVTVASGVTAAILYWQSGSDGPPAAAMQVGTGPAGTLGLSLGGEF